MIQLDINLRRELLADWVAHLGNQAGFDFGQYGGVAPKFSIGTPNGLHVEATFIDTSPFLHFLASDATHQGEIDRIAADAVARMDSGDFGPGVWYSTQLNTRFLGISAHQPA
jgi:hypothetical protein